jgi:hypothetical protein
MRRIVEPRDAPVISLAVITASPTSVVPAAAAASTLITSSFPRLPRSPLARPPTATTAAVAAPATAVRFNPRHVTNSPPPPLAPHFPLPPSPPLPHALLSRPPPLTGRPSKLGQVFVDALLTNAPVQVPNTKTGMEVWELESTLALRQVLLRESVRAFWKMTATSLLAGKHVVAVGSPGVGKSSTHPYLLKLLLETGRPVVFLKRGKDLGGKYYEFCPKEGGGYEAFEYKEKDVESETIPSLTNPSAFFLIEPMSQRSPPHYWIKARIALVCSPNHEHYRNMEKSGLDEFDAIYLYFPHWILDELYAARPFMCDDDGNPILANNEEVDERVRLYGLIPRHVFTEHPSVLNSSQNTALIRVSEHHVKMMMDALDSETAIEIDDSSSLSPSSYVIAYESTIPFTSRTIVIVSSHVKSEIWRLHSTMLLRQVEYGVSPMARHVFESYCREQIAKKIGATFEIRSCVGKREQLDSPQLSDYIPRVGGVKWKIAEVGELYDTDLHPETLYHSASDKQKLIDAVVKREDGGVDGFQFTLGETHTCNTHHLGVFASKFGTGARPFRLYYVVPFITFTDFVTDPVKPVAANAEVFVLCIPSSSSSSAANLASASASGGSESTPSAKKQKVGEEKGSSFG